MTTNQFFVHSIEDITNLPFSDREYSVFKCGSLTIAKKYGKQLAESFCQQILSNKLTKQDSIVIFPSAYSYIPCAAALMSRYFIRYVNFWLIENGFDAAMESKVLRKREYAEEYATLDFAERQARLKNDKYYIDTKLTENKIVIFIDDIFITGSHQIMLSQMYENNSEFLPQEIWFLYYAKLNNAAVSATFEGDLNYAEIKDIHGIKKLVETDEFEYIIRTVRYILQASEQDFYDFLRRRPLSEKETIYFSAICEGYDTHPKYKDNMQRLKMILHL